MAFQRTPLKEPSFRVNSREAFIKKHPTSIYTLNSNEQVTIGDMHGNTLKFIYFLIKFNVIDMEASDYIKIDAIYNKEVNELTKEDLETFNDIIENKIKIHPHKNVRLLGDEFADRGKNDYFTLKFIERIVPEVNFEFICSNHNIELIKVYENGFTEFKPGIFEPQAQSLLNLEKIMKKHSIPVTEIKDIIKYFYYPNLKMISYSLNDNNATITIYSHAPIGIKSIRALAECFNVEYKDATTIELATTIENINKAFSEELKNKTFHEKANTKQEHKKGEEDTFFDYPILHTIWARGYNPEKDPLTAEQNGYHIRYVHGHDGEGNIAPEYKDIETNLDNNLGKGEYKNKGELSVLLTQHHQLTLPERKEMIDFIKNNHTNKGIKKIQDELSLLLEKSKIETHSEKITQAFEYLKSAWEKEEKKNILQLSKVISLIKEVFSLRIEYSKLKAFGGFFESKIITPAKDQALKNIEYALLDHLKTRDLENIFPTMSAVLMDTEEDFTFCCGKKSKLAKLVGHILDHEFKQSASNHKDSPVTSFMLRSKVG